MEKVAIYACFKNNNRDSIDFFLKKMSDWCLLRNYDYTIYFDKVKKRTDLNRKELKSLINAIEKNKYSKVILKDITHLSINASQNVDFINHLNKHDCKIECIDGTDVETYKKIVESYKKFKEVKQNE